MVVGRHIGRRLGCRDPVAKIFRNDSGDPSERIWWGCTNFFDIERLNPLERRTIACAGAAAAHHWLGESLTFDPWTDPNFMSPTDWDMAECKPGEPDAYVRMAIVRLKRLFSRKGRMWRNVLLTARQLIVEAR